MFTKQTHPKIYTYAPYAMLVAAVFLVYANVYNNAFLYDDLFLIVNNGYLRHWGSFPGLLMHPMLAYFYRPLQETLYLIIYQLAGLSLPAFHVLNVGLHAVNACLVYRLGRKLGFNPWAVLGAAFVWALHPLDVEAVTYMSATADVLLVCFCLLGITVVVPDFSPRRMLAASGLFVLALLSKESAIVFPALVVVCLYYTSGQSLDFRRYLVTWPLWCIAALYLFMRTIVLPLGIGTIAGDDPLQMAYSAHILPRIYTALATLPSYFGLLVWPADLHMERDFPYVLDAAYGATWLGAFMLLAAIVLVVRARAWRLMPLGWGLLWFAAAHFPQTGVLIPVNSLFLEHWMYLPSIGLALGGAETLSQHIKTKAFRRIAMACTGVAVLLLGLSSFEQNRVWQNPSVFFNNILAHHAKDLRIRYHLALALMLQGKDKEAIAEFNKIIASMDAGGFLQRGDDKDPGHLMYVETYNNLGILYSRHGDFPKAVEALRKSIAVSDNFAEPHINLALLLYKQSQGNALIPEAIANVNRAIALAPDMPEPQEMLFVLYKRLGNDREAAIHQAKAAEIRKRSGSAGKSGHQ